MRNEGEEAADIIFAIEPPFSTEVQEYGVDQNNVEGYPFDGITCKTPETFFRIPGKKAEEKSYITFDTIDVKDI
jgi:hypothetical protein